MKKLFFVFFLLINSLFAIIPDVELALRAEEYDKALWYAQQAYYLASDENLPEIYYYLGVAYAGLNRDQLAQKAFDLFFNTSFDLDKAYKIAEYHQEKKALPQALSAYEKILLKYPEQKTAREEAGKLYFLSQEYKKTIALLSEILKENPERANPLAYYVGKSYYLLQDKGNAETYLKMAQGRGYNEADMYYTLGLINIDNGFYREGTESIIKGSKVSFDPVPPAVYFNLGIAYAKLGEHALAEESSKKAIEAGYNNVGVYINYATSAVKNQRYPQIIEVLEPKYNNFANNSKFVYLLAISYDALGQTNKAIDAYQRVIDLDPSQEELIREKMDMLMKNAGQ